jgi:hypothetical protein
MPVIKVQNNLKKHEKNATLFLINTHILKAQDILNDRLRVPFHEE